MLVATASPSPAIAQGFDCSKQEDVAALDQYCQPLGAPDGGSSIPAPPLERALPTRAVRQLEKAGELGETLLDLARVAPEAGGRTQQVLDADELLASGALGNPMAPDSAARTLTRTALGGDFAPTFRWGLLGTTILLVGASWLRYRARSRPAG